METSQTTITVGVGPVAPAEVVAVARGGARVSLSDESLAAIDAGRRTVGLTG
jgi:histidine ammonia-lyase